MTLEPDALVTLFNAKAGTSVAGTTASSLKVGDELVVIDGEAKKDLLAKVVEVAAGIPELAEAASWIGLWRAALYRAHRRFGTYTDLAVTLHRLGCERTATAVRLWVVGQTIGPRDPTDIRRVASCLEDTLLLKNAANVQSAMRVLRGAHRELGQRIGHIARTVGAATVAGSVSADELIDRRTGLTAGDFREAIEIVEIASISEPIRTPWVLTGRLTASSAIGGLN
jgi:hypothetical protein